MKGCQFKVPKLNYTHLSCITQKLIYLTNRASSSCHNWPIQRMHVSTCWSVLMFHKEVNASSRLMKLIKCSEQKAWPLNRHLKMLWPVKYPHWASSDRHTETRCSSQFSSEKNQLFLTLAGLSFTAVLMMRSSVWTLGRHTRDDIIVCTMGWFDQWVHSRTVRVIFIDSGCTNRKIIPDLFHTFNSLKNYTHHQYGKLLY